MYPNGKSDKMILAFHLLQGERRNDRCSNKSAAT